MADTSKQFDAIVVGAGFGGMYMLHLLRNMGLEVQGYERGSGVGGTWYWNRYPGCRCDVESMEYSYQFSDDLQQEWNWTERYSAQPEILAYANHVAEKFDIQSLIQFDTAIVAASYDAEAACWQVTTQTGERVRSRYLIMATGCLSAANIPDFAGLDTFQGEIYHTGDWPADGVDFAGKKVGIIGTGSSGIQSIPLIAEQAGHLTVFQRTPNYSVPAQNGPIEQDRVAEIKANYADFRARNKQQQPAFGADYPRRTDSVFDVSPEEREQRFEEYWNYGGFMFLAAFADISLDAEANAHAAEFVRNKIRATVTDPATAELLCPDTIIGCKRLCADSGYYATYNRSNVQLVDISQAPIDALTPTGLVTGGAEYEFDVIVFATGFDAMTGALLKADITGVGGLSLRDKWSAGPRTYLGLMTAEFPNLFMMTGPGSPSVLANMVTGVEHHAEFIAQMIEWAQQQSFVELAADNAAENQWVDVVNMRSQATLFPRCNSWYLGANVPGKPRVFMPYVGFPDYAAKLVDVARQGYEGFAAR
ncbi:MAG: NAD(P)/FAD-dependent oxidoreductase [Pseudomonadota bacterium]